MASVQTFCTMPKLVQSNLSPHLATKLVFWAAPQLGPRSVYAQPLGPQVAASLVWLLVLYGCYGVRTCKQMGQVHVTRREGEGERERDRDREGASLLN